MAKSTLSYNRLLPSGDTTTDTNNFNELFQAAINSGDPILLGPGDFHINSQMVYQWSDAYSAGIQIEGMGPLRTRIFNEIVAGGPLFAFEPTDPFKFVYHVSLSKFGLYGPTQVAPNRHSGMSCIAVNSLELSKMRFENFGGYGVSFTNESGDAYQSTYCRIDDCDFDECDEWGVDFGGQATTGGDIIRTRFYYCGGGLRIKPFGTMISQCGFAYNKRFAAIRIENRSGATSRDAMIVNSFFEGNAAGDVKFYGIGHKAICCNHNDNHTALNPPVASQGYGYAFGDQIAFVSGVALSGSFSAPDSDGVQTIDVNDDVFASGIESATIRFTLASNSSNNTDGIVVERVDSGVLRVFNPTGVEESSSNFGYAAGRGCSSTEVDGANFVIAGGGGNRALYYDAYRIGDAFFPPTTPGIRGLAIHNTNFQVFSGGDSRLTKYKFTSDTVIDTTISELGRSHLSLPASVSSVISVTEDYTPDLLTGQVHRITIATSSPINILAPTPALGDGNAGSRLLMRVTANVREAVVVFDPAAYNLRFDFIADPISSGGYWTEFVYDAIGARWVQTWVKYDYAITDKALLTQFNPGNIATGLWQPNMDQGGYNRLIVATNGTGEELSAPVSGIQTLTDSSVIFWSGVIGQTLNLLTADNAENVGGYSVLERPSANSITFYNPGGVAETSSFTWALNNGDLIMSGVANVKGYAGEKLRIRVGNNTSQAISVNWDSTGYTMNTTADNPDIPGAATAIYDLTYDEGSEKFYPTGRPYFSWNYFPELKDLPDGPGSYSGKGHFMVRVNQSETGFEFVAPSGGGGGGTFDSDVTVTASGSGFVVTSNDGTQWRIQVDNDGNLTTTSL